MLAFLSSLLAGYLWGGLWPDPSTGDRPSRVWGWLVVPLVLGGFVAMLVALQTSGFFGPDSLPQRAIEAVERLSLAVVDLVKEAVSPFLDLIRWILPG